MHKSPSLLDQVSDTEALWDAWIIAQRHAQTEHGLSRSARRFMKTASRRIPEIAHSLCSSRYRPSPLYPISIDKKGGGTRQLSVPSIADRIVERSLLDTINTHVDRYLGAAAYAYRPGLGVEDAVRRVCELRDEGLTWALRTDIKDCFDFVPRQRALDELLSHLPDASVDDLLFALTNRTIQSKSANQPRIQHHAPPGIGIPQGTALSPLLLNLLLAPVDDDLMAHGFQVIRYADDIVVLTETQEHAQSALEFLQLRLQEFGMVLNMDKTEIMDFDTGFVFLGEEFGPIYPALPPDELGIPAARRLYVSRQGTWCGMAKGRVLVKQLDEVLLDVPKNAVGGITTFGSVGVSAGLRQWCLQNDIPVVFLSRNGRYQGQLLAADAGRRVPRLVAQLGVSQDEERSLGFAREFIDSKIRNQMVLLRRFSRARNSSVVRESINEMSKLVARIPVCESRDELMGVEGSAAKKYFEAYGQLFPKEFRFKERTRRPPKDPVNSCLGYGYAILEADCVSALVSVGLDPGIGFLHVGGEHRRQSLALDLMEEFRPYVVDQVVLSAFRSGALQAKHFRKEDNNGVYLNSKGKQVLLKRFESRMLQVTGGAIPKFTGSIRRVLLRQAERLAVDCDDGVYDNWTGISWR